MNKKFSTLMASLLCVSAFSIHAADKTPVKIANLVDGKYIIKANGADSALVATADEGTAVKVDEFDKGTQLTLTKTVDGKTTVWVMKMDGRTVYAYTGNGQNGYWTDDAENTTASFKITAVTGSEDVATIVANKSSHRGTTQNLSGKTVVTRDANSTVVGFKTAAGAYSQFSFIAVPAKAPEGQTLADLKTNQTFLLQIDDLYVGAADNLLKATAGNGIQLAGRITNENGFAWVQANGGYQNVATGLYLNLTDGKLTLGKKPAEITTDGNALLVGGQVAGSAVVLESSTALPFVKCKDLSAPNTVYDGGTYLLVAGGEVIAGDQTSAAYDETAASQLWRIEVVKKGTNAYVAQFKNVATDKYLTVNGTYVYAEVTSYDSTTGKITLANGFTLMTDVNTYVNENLGETTVGGQAQSFGLGEREAATLNAGQLKWYEKTGFSVAIKGWNATSEDWDVTLKDNVFVGQLKPKKFDGTTMVDAADGDKVFFLQNGNGKYIVALTNLAEGYNEKSYKLTEVSKDALVRDIKKTGAQDYFGAFSFSHLTSTLDVQKITEIEGICVYSYNQNAKKFTHVGDVGRLDFNKVSYLAVEADDSYQLKPVQIKLGSDKIADWKEILSAKFFTVEDITTNAAKGYLIANGFDYPWIDDKVSFSANVRNVLEAQWALTYNEEAAKYVFTNRENPSVVYTLPNALYTTSKANTYNVDNRTLVIKPIEGTAATDGYKRLGDVKNQKFNIGYYSSVFNGNAWMTENHASDHTLGLDVDKEKASVWTATEYAAPYTAKENPATYEMEYTKSDSIYVISSLGYWNAKKEKQEVVLDTLKVVAYSFTNQYGEPMKYENGKYIADKEKAADNLKFTLRENRGHLNLRPVSFSAKEDATEALEHQTFVSGHNDEMAVDWYFDNKMYAGDAADGILANTGLYERTENDLFDVVATDAPMYRKVAKDLDVIAIHRDSNDKETLYESNGFLGLDNTVQFDKIAPAMIADTGMVSNTYRPTYLLAVGATVTPAGKYCPVHGADADCKDEHLLDIPGWVTGRYLVNLKDTAIAWDAANKHKDGNPYTNTENLYRLGFVKATHINDTLAIAAAKPAAKDSIYVGDGALTAATFAFRYVDQAAGSFVIETADYVTLPSKDAGKLNDNEGYIKWMNGVVVVVPNIKDADIFNMTENYEGEPTANEAIAAEGVQVIGGKGAVTVQGAAGKVITVANVLGQTIANQVAASDNVTIAAPAGVVVVAVEGEATKVVVK